MSRIGKKPVALPKGVSYSVEGDRLLVKGPKGEISRPVATGITFATEGSNVQVNRGADSPTARAAHGLMRALLAGMVEGVSKGFERKLEIVGVGFKAEIKGQAIVFALGYSHTINYPFPAGITMSVEPGPNNTARVSVKGVDKERVGQVASELRRFRSPDSYKGKGVRYLGEHVRIKAGKSGQK